ncbi:MAG TPA: zf-HC2 domain-containing protein [Actinomycetota bacterium]
MRDGTASLTCRELVELVTDYLEGALPPEERARFEQHIAGCRGCTTYLGQMREMLRLLGRLTEESVSPQAQEALLEAFHDWKR